MSDQCVLPATGVCEYIKTQCDASYYDIAAFYYCRPHSAVTLVTLSLMSVAAISLICVALSMIVSNYLLVNLSFLATSLHINQQLVSCIVVPLANSFPDLIAYYFALQSRSPDLVLGQVTGSLTILFTVVTGLVALVYPFQVQNRSVLTGDMAAVLGAIGLFAYVLSDGKITRAECATMVAVFCVYIVVLILFDKEKVADYSDEIAELIAEEGELPVYGSVPTKPDAALKTFSVVQLVVGALDLAISMVIPVVTYDDTNSLFYLRDRVLASPLHKYWLTFVTVSIFTYEYYNFDSLLVFAGSVACAMAATAVAQRLLSLSTLEKFTGIIGIVSSLILTGNVSVEILQMLKNLGLIWRMSEFILGLLVFSIANSLNDLITNLAMSAYNPVYGINACLGTPLLNILLGVGFNGLVVLHQLGESSMSFELNPRVIFATGLLMVLVAGTWLYLVANRWRFDRRLASLLFGAFIASVVVQSVVLKAE
ncbi:hypothetical protein DICA4_E12662 [Diutina catenulata]